MADLEAPALEPEIPPTPQRRAARAAAIVTLLVVALTAVWWAPPVLSGLAFFRVRRVEIVGTRYIAPSALLARLRVDTTMSIWGPLAPIAERVRAHPQVGDAVVRRKLPGTLVVRVRENLPVALVSSSGILRAVDSAGRTLPIDPSVNVLDLPIADRDPAILGLLAKVRSRDSLLFLRVSEVRRAREGEVVVHLDSLPVRARSDVTPSRLAEVFPVEDDLRRRRLAAREIDLRYRDQVVVRLQ